MEASGQTGPAEGTASMPEGEVSGAMTAVTIHQFRRLLIDRGGVMHTRADRQEWSPLNWINTLDSRSTKHFPVTLRVNLGLILAMLLVPLVPIVGNMLSLSSAH